MLSSPRTLLVAGALGIAALAGIAGVAGVASAHDHHEAAAPRDRWTGVFTLTDDEVGAIVSWAEPFATPADAEANGHPSLDLCFDHMGSHYADPASFGDGVLDAAKPEVLVYADVDGTEQLVVVEWVSTQPGEVLGVPLHLNHDLDVFVLHAWIGLENPAGLLADHNPNVGECAA